MVLTVVCDLQAWAAANQWIRNTYREHSSTCKISYSGRGGSRRGSVGGGGTHTGRGPTVILGLFVNPISERSRGGGGTCPLAPPPGAAPAWPHSSVTSEHELS